MEREPFYITTAIFYPTGTPHLGSAFEIIGTDVMARYQRLRGRDVRFLTGMDEHSQRVLEAARSDGEDVQSYVNRIAEEFRKTWNLLDIAPDGFIQTSEERHKKVVSAIFEKLLDQDDIYVGEYHGLYCSKCECFLAESQVKDGLCPECGRQTRELSERACFFRLSKYQKPLEDYMAAHADFILPGFRQTEMINSFLKPGLTDMCVSRRGIEWGVALPGEDEGVIYVWFDALINYLTGCGYLQDDEQFNRYWPADVHVIGKDIPRFHTILWPAMLMALGLELPKCIFIHGFILMPKADGDGDKMAKSAGNVVDPRILAGEYGADALRYFLLREVKFGGDGAYQLERMIARINFDLGNDLGNLLNRAVSMIDRYVGGIVPARPEMTESEAELIAAADALVERVDPLMSELEFSRALEAIWELVRCANRYVEQNEPWKLAKVPEGRGRLDGVLYCLAEALRVTSIWITPFMPERAAEMRRQLGLSGIPGALPDAARWGQFPADTRVAKREPLFPRVEMPE